MTGPPYPVPPGDQSNQIGQFVVGQSPIGQIEPFDYWQAMIAQYANSPIITQLAQNFSEWLSQTANFDAFYGLIWDINSAQGYGLDVWGRILNISRNISVATPVAYFRFDDPNLGFDSIGQIYNEGDPLTYNVVTALADTDFRPLLFAKAAANICNGSVPSIMAAFNQFYANYNTPIFIDEANEGPMAYAVCQVGALISLINLSILANELLPLRPTGVLAEYYVVSRPGPMFGFDLENSYISGFDVGNLGVTPLQFALATI